MIKPRRPRKESLRWFQAEWRTVLKKSPAAHRVEVMVEALAQLSYENKKLRERCDDAEERIDDMVDCLNRTAEGCENASDSIKTIAAFLGLGLRQTWHQKKPSKITTTMVMVGSTPHLHECQLAQKKLRHKMVDGRTPCTCGSEGDAEKRRKAN